MKALTILGMTATAMLGWHGSRRWGKMKEAFEDKVSFDTTDGGAINFDGQNLKGFVQVGITNASEETFVAAISRLDLVDEAGVLIAEGNPTPKSFTIRPDSVNEVKINISISLADEASQKRFAELINSYLSGNFTQRIRLIWKVVGKEITYEIPLNDFL